MVAFGGLPIGVIVKISCSSEVADIDFPNPAQTVQAWQATRQALGVEQDASLSQGEMSVWLKYVLIQGLQDSEIGTVGSASPKALRDGLESRLGALRVEGDFMANVESSRHTGKDVALPSVPSVWVPSIPAGTTGKHFNSTTYQQRLLDLALAFLLSESLAPEVCLEVEPLQAGDLALAGGCCHAVIFADAVFFHHEFYPLAVDAYEQSAGPGALGTQVLGAHVDWLSADGALLRVLWLDADTGVLREADLGSPLRPASVQFHSLGKHEQPLHRQWSETFLCPQANPYGPSSLADDKAATLAGWLALGVEVPGFAKLAAGDVEGAGRFAQAYREIVAKPNRSTEGDGVAYFDADQDRFAAEFGRHLESCWRQGDVLLQERRDGLIYQDSRSGTWHTLVLRLNLDFDGAGYQVASGYAQLGRDTRQPAACGRGGRIVSPLAILDGLFSRKEVDGPPFSLTKTDWVRLCGQAVRAASLFRGLLLVGLDVLLDVDAGGNILPVFLEANPRPAGLCHSRLLEGYPDSCLAVPGVSLKLWEGLERLR